MKKLCSICKISKEIIDFHNTNLQPLWAVDNIKKKDKLMEEYINRYKMHEKENQWEFPIMDSNKGLIILR